MAAHRVKRLPVVDHDRTLLGIVSRADVLRAVAALPPPAPAAEHPLPAAARTVADATITEVPVVAPDADAQEVLERVLATPLRRVVVVDRDGRALGLIGDRDVLARSAPEARPWLLRILGGQPAPRVAAAGAHPPGGRSTAASLMAPSLVTVRPEDSLVHAIRLMMQHRVKRLVVVDSEGRLRGLVDRREILQRLAEGGS
jgi:CBS-domain-containing membrane protein